MSEVEQKTYLGASITSVTCNVGWGSSPSTVQVDLVEDDKNNDNFIEPSIGSPTYFEYGAVNLGGLITAIKRTSSSGGDPLYSVTIEDPRSILDGVQLITGNYTGGIFGVPNLFNIYGYLESTGFGNSFVNNSGMPWYKIRDAFLTLQQTTSLSLGLYNFKVDLSLLPALPDYYRISGDVITLMDFINEVCDATSRDFFFNLEQVSNEHIIKLYVVDRSTPPNMGRISAFINSQDDIVSSDTGVEFRNEASSKFLVGGNKTDVYFQWPQLDYVGAPPSPSKGRIPGTPFKREHIRMDMSVEPSGHTIWPFWGVDKNGDAIIGEESCLTNGHNFTLDSRGVNVIGVGETYTSDIMEMRAAGDSSESWENLLIQFDHLKGQAHYEKATRLGLISDFKSLINLLSGKTPEEVDSITPKDFATLTGTMVNRASDSNETTQEENQNRLYGYVNSFSNEYYGKKFMVRIPEVQAKYSEEGTLVTSLEPTDGGYLTDVAFSGAVSQNLMPLNTNNVSLPDNRVHAFVKYNSASELDLGDLSPDDYVLRQDTDSVFIKCTVDSQVYFTNSQTAESPRVVIELPGRVTPKDDEDESTSFSGFFKFVTTQRLMELFGWTEARAKAVTNRWIKSMGGESILLGWKGMAQVPDMAAIPLKSNVDFYGPWYAVGARGKTEFERDESLVPWNYGGFELMDATGRSRVSSALSTMQMGEGGSLELPGVPRFNLGTTLVNGGPYITDISINVSPGGVTTTYRMQTWTPRLGKVPKQFAEKVQKMKKDSMRLERNLKNQLGKDSYLTRKHHLKLKKNGHEFVGGRPRRKKTTSTNQFLLAESRVYDSGFYRHNVVSSPTYHASSQLGEEDFDLKAAVSLDTLYTPFTTDTTNHYTPIESGANYQNIITSGISEGIGYLPHFNSYDGSETWNVNSLNPFSDGSFGLVSKDFPDEDTELDDGNGYSKALAFRMPMIGGGWGHDTNGNPVPNMSDINISGDVTEFVPDYKKRTDLWKVGPIELPWDEDRGVWVGGGGSNILLGNMQQNLLYRSSGVMNVWEYTSTSGTEIETATEHYVYDWFLPSGGLIYAGKNIAAAKIGSRYYVISAEQEC